MSEKEEELTVDGQDNASASEEKEQASNQESNSEEIVSEESEGQEEPVEEKDPIEALKEQVNAEKDKYVRLYAEFENFRRRTAKERIELISSATGDLMKEIIPVLDDFDRAIGSNQEATDLEAVKAGFELLHNKLYRLLENKGLKPMDSKGKDFDPEVHEAIAQIPAPSEEEKGKIIDVVEKGYQLNEKILRHPKVVVGQ
jgi:molecular chaperone GrpE